MPRFSSEEDILRALPLFQKTAQGLSDLVLANLVMIGEVPAPTFAEANRVRLLEDRFAMAGLDSCGTDEAGNAVAVLPGLGGNGNILLVAHADSVFPETADHTVNVQPGQLSGLGLSDNALGLAVLASLPHVLEALDIELASDLVFLGDARSLGRGDIEGVRFFLKNYQKPIRAGICVEGVQLGRLSHSSIGMLRGEIVCDVPEEYDWTRFGVVGAISILNEVINKIAEIPLPRRPRTSIVFGTVQGGTSLNVIATNASLGFEIRSESAENVLAIRQRIENICAEVAAQTNAEVELMVYALRDPGSIAFDHPLVSFAREAMKTLEIKPRMSPSTSELTAFIDQGIPGVTLGITSGDRINELDETIRIDPIFRGIAQLLGVLLAIDGGYCDEA